MYESPINLVMTGFQTQIIKQQEEQIVKAVQSVAVGVDHDELFRALKYDRDQYNKGYQDGKPKWIPVSEQLPDTWKAVLACRDFEFPDCISIEWRTLTKEWSNDNAHNPKVTHWMPLPEPPKEDL